MVIQIGDEENPIYSESLYSQYSKTLTLEPHLQVGPSHLFQQNPLQWDSIPADNPLQYLDGFSVHSGNPNDHDTMELELMQNLLISGNKRPRIDNDGPNWDEAMELMGQLKKFVQQINHWRLMYRTKEEERQQSRNYQNSLLSQSQKKGDYIDYLRKTIAEEQQQSQKEARELQHEVCSLQTVCSEYRRVLKEAQKAFAEYRARPNKKGDEEQLNRDGPGSRGLVLILSEDNSKLKRRNQRG